jgi:xanthine/uracil permease
VVQTLLFVTGINTLLQTLFGTRLPTVVGGSFAFLVPIVSIIHDSSLTQIVDGHQVCFTFSLISFFVWGFSGIRSLYFIMKALLIYHYCVVGEFFSLLDVVVIVFCLATIHFLFSHSFNRWGQCC